MMGFTTYSVSCCFRVLGSASLVPGAWSRVLDSACLVPGALFWLTEYKVVSYKNFLLSWIKQSYLWIFFFQLIVSLLFPSFSATKVPSFLVSSLLYCS